MTIEKIGSIGELIGALATLATLIYLAAQIRGNTRMMRSQGRHMSHQLNQGPSGMIAQHPQIAGVFSRGSSDFESLEPDEKTQYIFLISLYLTNFENEFRAVAEGMESEAYLEGQWIAVSMVLGSSGARTVWKIVGVSYANDFREYVDCKLSSKG